MAGSAGSCLAAYEDKSSAESQVQRPNTARVTLIPSFPKDNMFAERKQQHNK